jgi:hypothetical protein
MADYKVVYLIIERQNPELAPIWRVAGIAFVCRDGSLNLRLDIHPGLKFNIRDPKFNEPEDVDRSVHSYINTAQVVRAQVSTNGGPPVIDDIPF